MEYISDLESQDRWELGQQNTFEKLKKEALNPFISANQALKLIGYEFRKLPKIYDMVDEMQGRK